MILRIYTDGGCRDNQSDSNYGGWGAILEFGDHQKELYGGEKNTTNNRMEMTALLNALEAIKKPNQSIEIFSDSSYLMDCFRQKWYVKWKSNGWKTAGKKDVENRELWEKLLFYIDDCSSGHKISFYRVKGHVNLNSKVTNLDDLYKKFLEWNGSDFSFDQFCHVTKMNNRADELANMGMDQISK